VRPCTSQQRFLYLLELLVIQPGLAACSTGAAQSRGAAAPPFCVPTTHALATDPQFPSDCRKNHLARLEQTGCLFASMLQSLKIPPWRNGCAHVFSIGHDTLCVTILRETVTVLCEIL